jgi:hypothetical protein
MALFKVKAPKIGGTIGKIGEQAKKLGGQAWDVGVKQPTQAIGKAIETKSIAPITQNLGQTWDTTVKQPLTKLGQEAGIINKPSGSPSIGPAGSGPDYSQFKLNLTSSDPTGGADNSQANIASQYGAMRSLAKMREQGQAMSDQTAIQRRLAASGMSGSGAGMRMQGQADQASARRQAEQQLGIGAEEAAAQQRASESALGRDFQERQFSYQKQRDEAQFETDKAVTAENQKIARDVQRYNEAGLLGQLGQDIFGGFAKQISLKGYRR